MGGCCCSARKTHLHGTPVYYYVSDFLSPIICFVDYVYVVDDKHLSSNVTTSLCHDEIDETVAYTDDNLRK